MCGIAGKVVPKGKVEASVIEKMCDVIAHRGPDDSGIYIDEHIGLGQRRLSIIDLSKSATPPLSNEDDTIWIVFNGEIYNFIQLRKELGDKGHVFKTLTDTEVILHAYEEWGIRSPEKLRGMFAFAIWDSKKKGLFIVRDRLGKKPLYYYPTAKGMTFASEPKSLFIDQCLSREPDWNSLSIYLSYGFIPSPLCAFRGVRKMEPGCWLWYDARGEIKEGAFWKPPEMDESFAGEYEDAVLSLQDLLRDAVKSRMISDVPLGAFLSGGIDSATVVALMSEIGSEPVKTFSIGFEQEAYNELPHARLIAQRYATDHQELFVKPHIEELLPKLAYHLNEPFADSSAIPTYYVSEMAKKHVSVALTGDGGDELFAGYRRYRLAERWNNFGATFKRLACFSKPMQNALSMFPQHSVVAKSLLALRLATGSVLETQRALLSLCLRNEEKHWLLETDFLKNTSESASLDPMRFWEESRTEDCIQKMMRHDQRFCLPDRLLVKTDIASMANGLELRSPLLDHRILELAATFPTKWKSKDGLGKVILKDVSKKHLPFETLKKPKSGFSVPLGEWLRGPLNRWVGGIVLGDKLAKRKIFRPDRLARLFDDHKRGRRNWKHTLYSIVMLELWFEHFIDQ